MKALLFHLFIFIFISTFAQENADTVSIFFTTNASTIPSEERSKLEIIQREIQENRTIIIHMNGFSDTVGKIQENQSLSVRRLDAVFNELRIEQNSSNITRSAQGEVYKKERFPYSNSMYRRVDIIYQSKALNLIIEEIEPETIEVIDDTPPNKKSLATDFVQFLKDSTINEVTIQLSILFMPGTDGLLHPNDPQLNELFNFLHYNPTISAHIRGHVCCGDNLTLSHYRAMRIYNYLVRRSISPKRIDYQGYSNTIPFVSPEITKEDEQKNRRVDVIFSKHFAQ